MLQASDTMRSSALMLSFLPQSLWSRRMLLTGLMSSLLLISGCQTRLPEPASIPDQAQSIQALTAWQARGKVSTRVFGKTVSGVFHWQRLGDDFQAEGTGPLDQGRVVARGEQGVLTVEQAQIGTRTTTDPEALGEELAYTPLPAFHLNAWLSGWPQSPDTVIEPMPEGTGVRQFRERQWHIEVLSEQYIAPYRVPQRLALTWDHRRILIAITQWQAGVVDE